jgi:predicted ester cyclase
LGEASGTTGGRAFPDEHKALIRRYFATIDATCQSRNADILDEYLAPEFVEHTPFPGIPPTCDGWKQAFLMFDAATPGHHVVEDVIAEGDKVVARITAYGTHESELFGIPATGKPMRMSAIGMWRIADGKIVEHWYKADNLGVMQHNWSRRRPPTTRPSRAPHPRRPPEPAPSASSIIETGSQLVI